MAGLPTTSELKLRRSLVHRHYDVKRLDDGEDLNDALLDFFVKLGQAVIPCGGLEGGHPSVAYLGSLFYDMLRKGGTTDGRVSHASVANWAKRRLGQGGLFFDGMGALAVPVNETLRDSNSGPKQLKEKHWWLALLLNPRGGSRPRDEEDLGMLCLDSVARAETRPEPPVRATRHGCPGYWVEVTNLYRQGFAAFLRIRARGDGSAGPLPDPRKSRLLAGGREFARCYCTLTQEQRGGHGSPGFLEGVLEFDLDSAQRTCGEYTLEFGEPGSYGPPLRLTVRREPSSYQREVAHLLGGYVAKEWELGAEACSPGGPAKDYEAERVGEAVRLPDVPQQETANDCGFFILEMILLALQLTPEGFRTLARASTNMITTLPWPSQKQIKTRKAKLRDAVTALFEAADQMLSDDVEVLLKSYPELRKRVQAAMWDGPRFSEAVRTLASVSLPQQDFTLAELDGMPTKALCALCTQRGVLPPGTVERSHLLQVLAPLAQRARDLAPEPSPEVPPRDAKVAEANGTKAPPPSAPLAQQEEAASEEPAAKKARTAPEHLGEMRFSRMDLEAMPLKTLKGLCIQHKVFPACALERADFIKALGPLATDAAALGNAGPGPKEAPGRPESNSTIPTVDPAEDLAKRKARWAELAGKHLTGVRFEAVDLQVMPLKMLKALCVQHRASPACAVERADFVKALTPKVGVPAPGGQEAEPVGQPPTSAPGGVGKYGQKASKEPVRKDFSKFLGAMKPNFTVADLEEMPDTTLRTLCIQHGALPIGEPSRDALLVGLRRLAIPPAGRKAAPEVVEVVDE
mmetsp:Transcript_13097/g.37367  ORF Transcript_13097/g.37367 Transcript_13097/m.37367 type:complete len:803 (-) Transcript_13097:86-2494(-)